MSVPRNRVSVGVVDGMIYAVGGCAGVDHYNSVERYALGTQDRWHINSVISAENRCISILFHLNESAHDDANLVFDNNDLAKNNF